MSKLSKRDTILLVVIGLVAVLGGMYWFYVKPAKADLTATQTQVVDAEARVQTLQQQLATLSGSSQKPRTVPIADELRLAKAYPYSEDIPALILQLEDLAGDTKVTLGEANPGPGQDYAGVTGTPFTILVTGKFFDVQDFLYRLHNRVRVEPTGKIRIRGRMVAVTQADLTPGSDDTATAASTNSLVQANVTIVAFSRTAGGAQAPAADGSAPASTDTGGSST